MSTGPAACAVGTSEVTAVPMAAQARAPRVKITSRLSNAPVVRCTW